MAAVNTRGGAEVVDRVLFELAQSCTSLLRYTSPLPSRNQVVH
jgi:hypothetical protein